MAPGRKRPSRPRPSTDRARFRQFGCNSEPRRGADKGGKGPPGEGAAAGHPCTVSRTATDALGRTDTRADVRTPVHAQTRTTTFSSESTRALWGGSAACYAVPAPEPAKKPQNQKHNKKPHKQKPTTKKSTGFWEVEATVPVSARARARHPNTVSQPEGASRVAAGDLGALREGPCAPRSPHRLLV